MRRRLSHRTIIELLGDVSAVALALGVPRPNNVATWKKRGRGIPPIYWPAVEKLAREQGYPITCADLEATSPYARARRRRAA